jgi:hypothetical protein
LKWQGSGSVSNSRIRIKQSDPDPFQIEKPDPYQSERPDLYQKSVDPRQCSIFCVLFIGVPTALSLLLYFVIIVGVLCMATTILLIFTLPKILCLFLSPVYTDIVHLGSESCRYAGRAFIFKYSALIVIYFVPPSPPYSPTLQKVWTRVDTTFGFPQFVLSKISFTNGGTYVGWLAMRGFLAAVSVHSHTTGNQKDWENGWPYCVLSCR